MDDPTLSTSQTNLEILARGKDHRDSQARTALFDTYYPKLLAYARACALQPADCEDMAQECLRKLFEEILPRFEHDGRLGGFRAYLRNMVENEVKSRIRHQQVVNRHVRDRAQAAEAAVPQENLLDLLIEEEDVRFCLGRAMREVSPHICEIFAAVCLRGMPVAEVCSRFNVTPNVVYKAKNTVHELFTQWRARSAGHHA